VVQRELFYPNDQVDKPDGSRISEIGTIKKQKIPGLELISLEKAGHFYPDAKVKEIEKDHVAFINWAVAELKAKGFTKPKTYEELVDFCDTVRTLIYSKFRGANQNELLKSNTLTNSLADRILDCNVAGYVFNDISSFFGIKTHYVALCSHFVVGVIPEGKNEPMFYIDTVVQSLRGDKGNVPEPDWLMKNRQEVENSYYKIVDEYPSELQPSRHYFQIAMQFLTSDKPEKVMEFLDKQQTLTPDNVMVRANRTNFMIVSRQFSKDSIFSETKKIRETFPELANMYEGFYHIMHVGYPLFSNKLEDSKPFLEDTFPKLLDSYKKVEELANTYLSSFLRTNHSIYCMLIGYGHMVNGALDESQPMSSKTMFENAIANFDMAIKETTGGPLPFMLFFRAFSYESIGKDMSALDDYMHLQQMFPQYFNPDLLQSKIDLCIKHLKNIINKR